MLVTMSDGKQTQPTAVESSQQGVRAVETPAKPGKLSKKHVLIAVVCVVIAGLVVTAVLVGIRLISDSNKEILKLSLSLRNPGSNDNQQTISTDANDNIVIYRIKENGLDITVNDDFDKDLQVMKIVSGSKVECFVTPLNRSNALDLKSLPLPPDHDPSKVANITADKIVSMSYEPAPTPINDTTFLGKRANALCNNIPIYWLRPTCTESVNEPTVAVGNHTRSKRSFGCSCGWKQCRVCVFGKCFTITCGFECKCCLFNKCITAGITNPCIVCWLLTPWWDSCSSVCNSIFQSLSG